MSVVCRTAGEVLNTNVRPLRRVLWSPIKGVFDAALLRQSHRRRHVLWSAADVLPATAGHTKSSTLPEDFSPKPTTTNLAASITVAMRCLS
jgi:hypothetical protein